MATALYLDTARLGRMCRGARLAEQDFGWLVGRLGSSLYLERFLTRGYGSLPARLRRTVPYLRCWPGAAQFRRIFGRSLHQPAGLPTYLFAQSFSLIRFAAECMFESANTVLTTDLAWPPYLDTLQQVAQLRNATLHVVRLRQMVFDGSADIDAVSQVVTEAYRAHACDGLFLSDISYLGVRMPVRQIINGVARYQRPFAAIDGAQAVAFSKGAVRIYLDEA